MNRKFTEEEDKYLRENFRDTSYDELAQKLGRSYSSIKHRCHILGLVRRNNFVEKKWSTDEIKFLKDNINLYSFNESSKIMNRTSGSIRQKCKEQNIIKKDLIKQRAWSKEDEQYLIDHYYTSLVKDLSKHFDITEGAIRAKCHDLGLVKKDKWSQQEIDFILNNQDMTFLQIAKKLNRSKDAVAIKFHKLGLKKSPYTCQYDFFENINSEEKAYWLGFICGDGWVSFNNNTKSGVVGIEIQYKDIDHLKKFNKSIHGNYKITARRRKCPLSKYRDKVNHYCCIRVFSQKMYKDLKALGIGNNKTYDLKMPDIDNHLMPSFLRGYFDADGCLSYKHNKLHLNYISASKNMADATAEVLRSYQIDCSVKKVIRDNFAPVYITNIKINCNNASRFFDLIYGDATIYLTRKYNKYLMYEADHNYLFTQKCASKQNAEENGKAEMPIRVEGCA